METYSLQNEKLRVEFEPDACRFSVMRRDVDLRWTFQRNTEGDLRILHGDTETLSYLSDARVKRIHRFSMLDEERLVCEFQGLPGKVGLSLTLALPHEGDMLRIEVEKLPTTSSSRIAEVWYPGHLCFIDDEEAYTLWPNGAGMMLPAHHDQEIVTQMSDYETQVKGLQYAIAYSWHLYQPWWGVVGRESSYMAIAETPFDFALELKHPRGGPTFTRPVWVPSMGSLSYPRAIRYHFLRKDSHVELAKIYRDYAQKVGRWVSLKAKFERNPNVRRLLGSVILPVSVCRHNVQTEPTSHETVSFEKRSDQVRRLREMGRKRLYLHIDGWGYRGYDNQHPDFLPPCPEAGGWEGLVELSKVAEECGYLFGLHDQYRDYYLDAPTFSEKYAVKLMDGTLPQWSRWAGGPQTLLCAKEVLPYLRRNYTRLNSHGVRLTASYLDVFSMNPLDECYDLHHNMTREDCYRWRAKAFEYMRNLGMAVSSEEPADCFIPHLDFVHWNSYPREPVMAGDYLGIPVPLHTLVYHDALFTPSLFDYRSSDKSSQYFLEGLSQVQIPYGCIDWDSQVCFEKADILAQLHKAWGTHELVDHCLLDTEGMIQKFEYPEGEVSIDLKNLRYRIEGTAFGTDGWIEVTR